MDIIPQNQDIAKALEQFEKESQGAPVSPSTQDISLPIQIPDEPPKIIKKVIKYSGGLIQTEQQANYILLALVIIIILISALIFWSGGQKQQNFRGPIFPAGTPIL